MISTTHDREVQIAHPLAGRARDDRPQWLCAIDQRGRRGPDGYGKHSETGGLITEIPLRFVTSVQLRAPRLVLGKPAQCPKSVPRVSQDVFKQPGRGETLETPNGL